MKATLLYLLCLSGLIYRLLLGTLLGIGIVVITSYFLLHTTTGIKPLSPIELLLWFDDLPEGAQALFASSAITIIGFLVAFQSATTNWKEEMQADLRLDVAREINTTYGQASSLISSIEIYLRGHLSLIEKIRGGCAPEEALAGIRFLQQSLDKFEEHRSSLYSTYSQACGIIGQHSLVLMAAGNALDQIHQANQAIEAVTNKLGVYVPRLDLTANDWKEPYLHFFSYEQAGALVKECQSAGVIIPGKSGGAKGHLTSTLLEINVSMLMNFQRKGRSFLRLTDAINTGRIGEAERAVGKIFATN